MTTDAPPTARQELLSPLIALLLFLWLEGVALVSVVPFWITDLNEAAPIGLTAPPLPLAALLAGLAMLVPLLPFVRWRRNPRYGALFRLWALGALYVLWMAPIRLVPLGWIWLSNLIQIAMSLLFLLALRRLAPPVAGSERAPGAVAAAAGMALLVGIPWILSGALGSPLDTLLNLISGLLFGRVAARLLADVLLPHLGATGWDLLLGGFGAGVLLNLMGAAWAIQGMALPLMLAVPALGWLAAGLSYWGNERAASNRAALTLLLGLSAALPAILFDPDELTLVLNLSGREILFWLVVAAYAVMLIGWVMAAVVLLARRWIERRGAWSGRTLAVVGVLVALVVYWRAGQPGFHGDRLFVILAEQSDLSRVAALEGREMRTRAVYDTLTSHATRSQARLRARLDRIALGYRPYYLVNAFEVEGGPLVEWWLERQPEVARVIPSPRLRPLPAPPLTVQGFDEPPDGILWNLELIGAARVWEEFGARGQGIVVGNSDSGVQADHPELADSYRGRLEGHDYAWYDPWRGSRVPYDTSGHGTHTLGSVLGNQVGVAPDAEFIACVNLERNLGNPALYLDCLQFMLAPFPPGGDPFIQGDPARGAHILNNSWGCPEIEGCDATSLQPAISALRAAGIFVVASAGNGGPLCGSVSDPPAIYDEALSVGAVDQRGILADFSSRGPVTVDGSGRTKPDIVAPGDGVLSAYPGDSYSIASGTSMAGPHVAGVVALLWSAAPELIGDVERTEQILLESARPVPGAIGCGDASGASNAVGYGLVDALEAVRRAVAE